MDTRRLGTAAGAWATTDRRGRPVALTARWRAHILDRHAEIAAVLPEIRRAVEAPERVTRSLGYAHREVCHRRIGNRWLRVVVHYSPIPPDGTWAGEVRTAFFVKHVPPEEEQLWP